ncbi:MAG: EI24 domain-containing protein [Pseudomonadota bacterium]
MRSVLTALVFAVGQLTDPAVLRVLAKTVVVTVLIFAALGWALWLAISAGLQGATLPFLPEDFEGPAAAAFALFLGLVLFWLLFRVVALAVLQLFADEIVIAVEQRHYPEAAARAKPLPFHRDLANSLRSAGRALLYNALAAPVAAILFFTVIGAPAVFLLVNAVLLGRELTDMAWLRHCELASGGEAAGNPVSGLSRVLLGAVIAGLMLVPFVNLVAPVIGAAAGTHLTLGALGRREEERQSIA